MEIDGYTDLVEIGRGASAVVYRAVQQPFGRMVALKVLGADRVDPDVERRFERECQVVGGLAWHPRVVPVFDAGVSPAGHPYLAMELMAGGSLATRVRDQGPLAVPDALSATIEVADALEAAHRAGVLHRDVKPANILSDRHGHARLADFGVASLVGAGSTATGAVIGTMAYMAPELLTGSRASVASDVYSLGATLYTLLAGQAPFTSKTDETPLAALMRIAIDPVPDLRDHGFDARLADLVAFAMAKDPAQRPTSAAAFAEGLTDLAAALGVPVPSIHFAEGPDAATPASRLRLEPTDDEPGASAHHPVGRIPGEGERSAETRVRGVQGPRSVGSLVVTGTERERPDTGATILPEPTAGAPGSVSSGADRPHGGSASDGSLASRESDPRPARPPVAVAAVMVVLVVALGGGLWWVQRTDERTVDAGGPSGGEASGTGTSPGEAGDDSSADPTPLGSRLDGEASRVHLEGYLSNVVSVSAGRRAAIVGSDRIVEWDHAGTMKTLASGQPFISLAYDDIRSVLWYVVADDPLVYALIDDVTYAIPAPVDAGYPLEVVVNTNSVWVRYMGGIWYVDVTIPESGTSAAGAPVPGVDRLVTLDPIGGARAPGLGVVHDIAPGSLSDEVRPRSFQIVEGVWAVHELEGRNHLTFVTGQDGRAGGAGLVTREGGPLPTAVTVSLHTQPLVVGLDGVTVSYSDGSQDVWNMTEETWWNHRADPLGGERTEAFCEVWSSREQEVWQLCDGQGGWVLFVTDGLGEPLTPVWSLSVEERARGMAQLGLVAGGDGVAWLQVQWNVPGSSHIYAELVRIRIPDGRVGELRSLMDDGRTQFDECESPTGVCAASPALLGVAVWDAPAPARPQRDTILPGEPIEWRCRWIDPQTQASWLRLDGGGWVRDTVTWTSNLDPTLPDCTGEALTEAEEARGAPGSVLAS